MKEETILLHGIVGSTAYGLAKPGSDVDRIGLFAAPTAAVLGLHPPKETQVSKDPDITLHEVAKYCRLALKANPTVMELLWLPDDLYEVRTPYGDQLIKIRSAFLSAPYVRNAYFGYAEQQFTKLQQRGGTSFGPDLTGRTAKHARHMLRLLQQGYELWSTGTLTIRVPDPDEVHTFGERVLNGDLGHARKTFEDFQSRFDTTTTELPPAPDEKEVEEWLLKVRGIA